MRRCGGDAVVFILTQFKHVLYTLFCARSVIVSGKRGVGNFRASNGTFAYFAARLRRRFDLSLERDRFAVFAPDLAESVADLADGHVGFDGSENVRKEV